MFSRGLVRTQCNGQVGWYRTDHSGYGHAKATHLYRTTIRTTIRATRDRTRGTHAGGFQSQNAETELGRTCLAGKGSPGFESPMLHLFVLNSKLALADGDCQLLA